MAGFTKRIIDLRPGEGGPVAGITGLLALLIGAHTMLETARDALFLEKLPPNRLTLVYVILAVLSLVAASASAAFTRRFGRKAGLVFTLLACAYGTAVFYLRPATSAMVFGFYLLSGVIGTVLLLQFWMFAATMFTVSQGKRLFGPIASGGVVGATGGATLAALLLRFMHVKSLLLVAGAVFLLSAALLASTPDEEVGSSESPSALEGLRGLGVLRKEPYVGRVAIVTGLGTATVLVVDYLFKSVAAATFAKHDLGSFFAVFYASQNAISLLVQLFLTGAVISRFGVTSALLVLPLLLTVGGTSSFILGGSLIAAMVSKGADGSLRYSLHRVASELLVLPLPGAVRSHAKALLDTLFGRGVQAATAAIIFVAAAGGYATPRLLGAAVGVLSLMWLMSAITIRRPYVDLFRRALSLGNIIPDPIRRDLDLDSVEELLESLSSTDEERALAALEIFEQSGRTRLIPGLVLSHDSPRILERALGIISQAAGRHDWIPLAERLLHHANPSVRAAAVRALASSDETREESIAVCLDDASEVVRAEAVFFLAKRHAPSDPASDPLVTNLFTDQGDQANAFKVALLGVIADHGDPAWGPVVHGLLDSGTLPLEGASTAAMAIRRIQDPAFLPYLINALAVRDGRGAVRDAIVALGAPGYDAVCAALDDPQTDPHIRLHLPRTISRFATQGAVDFLTERLIHEEDGAVRYKILRGIGRLSTNGVGPSGERLKFKRAIFESEVDKTLKEHFRLMSISVAIRRDPITAHGGTGVDAVLLGLIDDKTRQALERAFRLLALAHRNEDIRGVYAALENGDRSARANALEFLDALSFSIPSVRQLLRITADDLAPDERVARAAEVLPEAPPGSSGQALRRLMTDSDDLLAALAAYSALDLGLVDLRKDVLGALEERPQLFNLTHGAPKHQLEAQQHAS